MGTFLAYIRQGEVTAWEEEGVDLVAMNFELDRPHFDRENPQRLKETVKAVENLVRQYAFTVLDTCWPHQVVTHLQNLIQTWLVIADAGRIDTLHSALQLQRDFQERDLTTRLIINKRRRENLQSIPYDLALPHSSDAHLVNAGKSLLALLYPQREVQRSGLLRRLLGAGS